MCKLSTANSFGRRQQDTVNLDKRTQTVVCSKCCDSKNMCNREGCGKSRKYSYKYNPTGYLLDNWTLLT